VPGATGSGASEIATETSALPTPTAVIVAAESLAGSGSVVAEPAVTVLPMSEPVTAPASTATTRVNVAVAPAPSVAAEQSTVPAAPTAGVVHDQPAGDASETKLVPAGTGSASVALVAAPGPAFATVIV
jgi:hypothetical protein